MTEIKGIKAAAKAAFEEKDYKSAFQILWKAGVKEFVRFGEKQSTNSCNWFIFPLSAEFFWNNFIQRGEIFGEIFNSDSAEQLLHDYFSKATLISPEFEVKLANEYPQIFVKAIRVNQTYLKRERIDSICNIPLGEDLKIHQKVWKAISDTDKIIWQNVRDELNGLSKVSLSDVLSHCTIWLENNRFYNNSKENIHHLAAVYSFFIEITLSKYPEKKSEMLTEETFLEQFCHTIFDFLKENKTIEVTCAGKILNQISQWLRYKDEVISPYSFDLDIQPKQENELILFNVTPESRYNWRLNGVRYEINQLRYFLSGTEMVEYLEENDFTKIPGHTKEDIELNRKLAALKWSTQLLLIEMGINSFRIGNSDIEIEILLRPLIAHSFNRMNRYELGLIKYCQNSKSSLHAMVKLFAEMMRTRLRLEPYLFMSKKEFKELNKAAIEQLSEESAEQVVQIAGYEISSKYEFYRFNHRYDVFQKPLLKLGDNLFCPMMFFSSNIWFYTFAQEALIRFKTIETERNETRVMENYFGKQIEQKGWRVRVLNDNEANQIQGDVDIFVEDNHTILFIQLKRTYFRLTLKDAYYESINTDKKAANQLNEAEEFLKKDNSVYTVSKKPIKWIVSTSYENIGANINGCRKVNYFDVLNALKNPEIISLNDLIVDIERDRNLKKMAVSVFNEELPHEWRIIVTEAGLPLKIFETKEYRQVIFSEDELKTREYNELFNQAIALDMVGKKNDALVLLKKCIAINQNDAEAYAAIANTLVDLRSYEVAYSVFKKALELAPDDPYISRNYSVALMESGRYYDGLCIALKMFEKFPLLQDIQRLFEENFLGCIKLGVLHPDQVIELLAKWHSLK